MKRRESALRGYYHTIRSYLPCSYKQKKRIINEIQLNINAYLEEHPDADFAQIEVRFGNPRNIAAAYVDDMNTSELLQALRMRRRITTPLVVGLIIALSLWGCFLGLAYTESISESNGTIEHFVEIVEPTE